MNKICKVLRNTSGWFRRNNTIMAQAKVLSKQLQEARDVSNTLGNHLVDAWDKQESLTEQLHRVARERDDERGLRLDLEKHYEEQIAEERGKRQRAESALLDKCLKQAAEEMVDIYLAEAPNEEE